MRAERDGERVVGFVQLAAHTPDEELAYTSSLDRTVRRRTVPSHVLSHRAAACGAWARSTPQGALKG